MATPISQDLINEFYKVADEGDEAQLKKFLIENIKRFPQEAQNAIITAFFEDALKKKAEGDKAIASFQEEALKMLRELDKVEKELKKQEKLNEIKNG